MFIFLKAKNNVYDAKAIYENGVITVLPGSKIRLSFANHIRGGNIAKKYREDSEYVDSEGVVIKDCKFSSASTAAQFVTGCSINGLKAWKTENNVSLKNCFTGPQHG